MGRRPQELIHMHAFPNCRCCTIRDTLLHEAALSESHVCVYRLAVGFYVEWYMIFLGLYALIYSIKIENIWISTLFHTGLGQFVGCLLF